MEFFQTGWKWCRKCQGLFYTRNASQGVCPEDRQPHDGSQSWTYALFTLPQSGPSPISTGSSGPLFGQQGWKWCRKCQALFYGENPSQGVCAADRSAHDGSGSGAYIIDYTEHLADRAGEPHQNRWRWCPRCQQLTFNDNPTVGACAAGGEHTPSGYDYILNVAGPLHDASEARLLVIAPTQFQEALWPLIAHKNATGMPSFLVTREAITDHFIGRDDPEKIKRAIAFGYEYLKTRYVMLVGDASLMPVRYRCTSIPPGGRNWRDAWYTPADLYYANLYRNHVATRWDIGASGGFANWDSNGDNKFNEHHWSSDTRSFNPDQVDGVADVAVGRLPAHTVSEVTTYVDKIIRYEAGRARAPQVSMTVFVDKDYGSAYDLAQQMIRQSGISTSTPAWSLDLVGLNYGSTNPPAGVQRGLSSGTPVANAAARSFWLTYIGHGYDLGWGTNELNQPLNSTRVEAYTNSANLPIVYVAGCDTGQFINCPPNHKYRDVNGRPHWYWAEGANLERPDRVYDLGDRTQGSVPVQEWRTQNGVTPMITPQLPHSYDFPDRNARTFARAWLCSSAGGAIAYFGETTTCQNNWGTDLGAYMLRAYVRGERVLGEVWRTGQREYWKNYRESEDMIGAPRLYLTYMTMFGDPSLRIP